MEKYLPLLKGTSLFLGMDEQGILSVLRCLDANVHRYERDSYISRVGTKMDAMGLVLAGRVLLIQEDAWGRRSIMDALSAGDCFGETFAASSDNTLNINVVADEPCEIVFLPLSRVLHPCPAACAYHTQVMRNLIFTLADKALRLNNKITHMSKRSTREKLLSFLSAESIRQGSLSFRIEYNRQQLADYLNVERAAMSVALSRLQKEGLISYNRNHFTLHESCFSTYP